MRRARKKARQKEMESQLDKYNSRLDNLSQLKAATSDIEKQNAALEEELHARETQLLEIRHAYKQSLTKRNQRSMNIP